MTKVALVAMLGLAVVAFGIGPLLHKDQIDPSVTPEAARRLKTQLALGYTIHPLVLQVTEARMTGNTPDHIEGTGVWRTLFGIPVGERRLAYKDERYNLDTRKWILVWGIFLLVEGALGAFILRRMLL